MSVETIPNNTSTYITFDSEDYDDNNYWTVGSPTRLTVTDTGRYLFGATVVFDSNATGSRGMAIEANRDGGTEVMDTRAVPQSSHGGSIIGQEELAATNYIELRVVQNSGGNLDVLWARFWITRIG